MTEQPLTETERLLPPHLGGHFGNVNKDWPTLRYLMQRYGCQDMLDVGCGPGGMLDEAIASGMQASGIDGDPYVCEADRRITCHDYTRGPLRWMPVDLIWCTEFVEHVEAIYLGNILLTFDAGRILFLTAAPPGFPGHHHVNCLIEGTPVQASGVLAATRRAYHGDVVTIVTASGHKLTVTPNHPILTNTGWVAAERIREGDHVISRALTDRVVTDVVPDNEYRPVPVEEIFRACIEVPNSIRVCMPGTAEDFHGDGRQSDVDVVWPDCTLETKFNVADGQPPTDSMLQVRDAKLSLFVRDGSLACGGEFISILDKTLTERRTLQVGEPSGSASHCLKARNNNSGLQQGAADDLFTDTVLSGNVLNGGAILVQPNDVGGGQHFAVSALRFASDGDATINQDATSIPIIDVGSLRKGGETFAGYVAPDEVISVERSDHVGHVYNLHTDSNWYVASSIITHNCQPESYWVDTLAARGWILDDEATQWVRTNGGHAFTTRQGLVFVRS